MYLLQYRQLTPVAQQSLQTDSALILIFGSHTHGDWASGSELNQYSETEDRAPEFPISPLRTLIIKMFQDQIDSSFCPEQKKIVIGRQKKQTGRTQNGFRHKAHISIGKLLERCQEFSEKETEKYLFLTVIRYNIYFVF